MVPVRIALVNDHPIVLEGLRALLRPFPQVEVIEMDVLTDVAQKVDLALIDTHGQSVDVAEEIRRRSLDPQITRVAAYSWTVDETMVDDALAAGATGVISKTVSSRELADALRRMMSGETVVLPGVVEGVEEDVAPQKAASGHDWPGRSEGLSMREAEMITLICQGLSNEQIAERLYLSPNSVKSYIRAAYQKIGVNSRSQAVIWGIDHDMRPVPERDVIRPLAPGA
ncbi:response regulator transcription factor [Luteococcus peritonei]|uniref:LuxR C-terminal-related transcriptional regulator n=1 Tax=Luteococcus peritonei TaxID=88874 RepID=A0ABW4RXE6_9ACTN